MVWNECHGLTMLGRGHQSTTFYITLPTLSQNSLPMMSYQVRTTFEQIVLVFIIGN